MALESLRDAKGPSLVSDCKLDRFYSWHDFYCLCDRLHDLYTAYNSMYMYMTGMLFTRKTSDNDDDKFPSHNTNECCINRSYKSHRHGWGVVLIHTQGDIPIRHRKTG